MNRTSNSNIDSVVKVWTRSINYVVYSAEETLLEIFKKFRSERFRIFRKSWSVSPLNKKTVLWWEAESFVTSLKTHWQCYGSNDTHTPAVKKHYTPGFTIHTMFLSRKNVNEKVTIIGSTILHNKMFYSSSFSTGNTLSCVQRFEPEMLCGIKLCNTKETII